MRERSRSQALAVAAARQRPLPRPPHETALDFRHTLARCTHPPAAAAAANRTRSLSVHLLVQVKEVCQEYAPNRDYRWQATALQRPIDDH